MKILFFILALTVSAHAAEKAGKDSKKDQDVLAARLRTASCVLGKMDEEGIARTNEQIKLRSTRVHQLEKACRSQLKDEHDPADKE